MKFVKIQDWMFLNANKKSKNMGKLKNSITSGEGNLAGFLGEEIIKFDLGEKCTECNTYDYDIILKNKIKIDVKTKRTTVEPLDYYECSVAEYNTKQKCHVYAFVRVDIDKKMS